MERDNLSGFKACAFGKLDDEFAGRSCENSGNFVVTKTRKSRKDSMEILENLNKNLVDLLNRLCYSISPSSFQLWSSESSPTACKILIKTSHKKTRKLKDCKKINIKLKSSKLQSSLQYFGKLILNV